MSAKMYPISVRLDVDVREGIEELAQQDQRSLSAYINLVLWRHLQTLGKAPEKRLPPLPS